MSLFGSRRRTQVGTAVSRLVEDEVLPDVRKTAPIKAILGNTSISGTLIDDLLGGAGMKVERGFKYAKSGKYTLGLPNHTFVNESAGLNEISDYLTTLHGGPITVVYHRFSSLHNLHYGFQKLLEDYEYKESTNEITALSTIKGFPVYLEHMIGSIDTTENEYDDVSDLEGNEFIDPTADSLSLWETPPDERYTPWVNSWVGTPYWQFDALPTSVRFHYAYNNGTDIVQGTEWISMSSLNKYKTYLHTKYYYDLDSPTGAKIGYITYEYQSGFIPNLDDVNKKSKSVSEFMPIVFFRTSKQDITTEEYRSGEDYKTANRLMDIMGLDYQSISDSIHDPEINPEVDKLEETVLLFGIPLNTEDQSGKLYLFNFFKWIATNDTSQTIISYEASTNIFDAVAERPVDRGISIEDERFKLQINYGGIAVRARTESVLEIGEVHISTRTRLIPYTVSVIDNIHTSEASYHDEIRYEEFKIVVFKKQLTATTYEEVIVGGLESIYRVYGLDVYVTVSDNIESLLVPLHHGIVHDTFNFIERDRFYALSMHLVFHTRVTTRIPWYATTIFRVFIVTVAMVLTVLSLGSAAPGIQVTFGVLASSYGIVTAAVIMAMKYLALNYALEAGFKFAVDKLGEEVALALAALALSIGIYGQTRGATWATNLLKFSSGLTNAVKAHMQTELALLQQEQEDFFTESQERQSSLDEQLEALPSSSLLLDATEILDFAPMIILGETPDQFYNRTTGLTDISNLSYAYIENYVELNTRLPSFEDTIGGFIENGTE